MDSPALRRAAMSAAERAAGSSRCPRVPTPRASSRSAESRCPSLEDFPPLPPIGERLAHLNPSHELLDYYRRKIADFDEEHEELVKRLEKYKQTYDEQVTVLQRPPETHEQDDVSSTGTEKSTSKAAAKVEKLRSSERDQKDDDTLLLQVKALQAQIEEQTRLTKEQVESLLEDRRIQMEEAEVRHQKDQDKIKAITEKLHKTQNLLYESTRDFLQLKFDARANEKAWMAEKDSLLRKLGKDLDQLAFSTESGQKKQTELKKMLQGSDGASKCHSKEIKLLQDKLVQEKHLSHMYREQCVSLEGEVARMREERDAGKELFQERSEKMGKRLKLMTQRCEALEKRRNLEVEGFKNDIKQLQQKLKDVEKKIYKVAMNLAPDDQDLAILREIRQGNKLTRKIQGELKDLKTKIYILEDELRHC
ncbi:coiled-coil domain-containing protein 77 isoform X3 [Ammospiza nelsoni]|uniref:coiled-coil domain-containing protein 77 isoform X3 n=1 Tax=Ammospiza caudacuta TaxID=2857398 RepID=UPI00273867A4|nr:coiled-coil domain-containing protein 77 isoform X3 [Ammospiza caudacuta]XP_059329087.1 coiled-coil domain-containing protein 77 isoform X3 [Ammospiza nelsoni]